MAEDYAALLKTEADLEADTTKAGKSRFSTWRMAHAKCHHNIQPGRFGEPFLEHDMSEQIVDPLHLSELNMPKIPWKHGLLVHASDDCRELISEKLKEWKHPLDCRRKDDNRLRAQKWFTGEAWRSFAAGHRGSPGAPIAIATLLLMVAEDMLIEGREAAAQAAVTAAVGGRGRGRGARGAVGGRGGGQGRARFMERQRTAGNTEAEVAPVAALAEVAGAQREPSAIESRCEPADLEMIQKVYGSRARTVIDCLLAWDAYLEWYYPYVRSIPFRCPMSLREQRAFDNMCKAIDMQESFERISINNHKSFCPHIAVYKCTRDILKVGDPWAADLEPLELQNAETKRVASAGGSRRLEFTKAGKTLVGLRGCKQGPMPLTDRKEYSTTCALSTMNNLLVTQKLRRGDGPIVYPKSRRAERLFGEAGRTKRASTHIRLVKA